MFAGISALIRDGPAASNHRFQRKDAVAFREYGTDN
jgi:hypothetical protein